MKLRGIASSKGRNVVHERNRDIRAPADTGAPAGHTPTPYPDGSLACSACGTMRYSPSAFGAHVAGKPVTDSEGSVYTLGVTDPWVVAREQSAEHEQKRATDDAALERERLIDLYFEKQRRGKPRDVDRDKSTMFD